MIYFSFMIFLQRKTFVLFVHTQRRTLSSYNLNIVQRTREKEQKQFVSYTQKNEKSHEIACYVLIFSNFLLRSSALFLLHCRMTALCVFPSQTIVHSCQ